MQKIKKTEPVKKVPKAKKLQLKKEALKDLTTRGGQQVKGGQRPRIYTEASA